MTSWHWLALIAVSISTLYWLVAFVSSILTARGVARISELHAPEPSRWPRISVIIPACNEAHTVEAAVRSKLANRYPELELVLVDDRSSDGTGEIADRISAEDERVRVTHISSLPNGWLGKLNALETGRRAATGEWLLFSDADVHVGPEVLRRVIAWCEATNTDFFSCLVEGVEGGFRASPEPDGRMTVHALSHPSDDFLFTRRSAKRSSRRSPAVLRPSSGQSGERPEHPTAPST